MKTRKKTTNQATKRLKDHLKTERLAAPTVEPERKQRAMTNIVPLHSSDQSLSVLHVRPSPKPGAVKAYADIQYHAATIKGLSIVEYKNAHFVGFPSEVGKNGKRFPKVEFSEPARTQIEKLVLEAARQEKLI
jgi:DNA-binding cell septation regulator SpoVG